MKRTFSQTKARKVFSRCGSEETIKPSHRHVGLYYWCAYWHQWDKVLAVDVDGYKVRVVCCDVNGDPMQEPREHCTGMAPAMFADKPFVVTYD